MARVKGTNTNAESIDYAQSPMTDPGHKHSSASLTDTGAVRNGAGAPAAGLGNIGDLYYRTDGASGTTLLYIKTGASTWTGTAA
jgi:hypothetical protein